MRNILLLAIFFLCSAVVNAKHITGGEIIYVYTGDASPSSKYYRITLRLFRDENCVGCADMPLYAKIGIFNTGNNSLYAVRSVDLSLTELLPLNGLPPCITNPPNLIYSAGYYSFLIELPNTGSGYTISYQTCCRIDGIWNIPNSVGATFTAKIPGTSQIGTGGTDDSPQFARGISVVCYNKPFTLDFSAQDADGDSLVYSMCNAYTGGNASSADPTIDPLPPPYNSVQYINGYSGAFPLGTQATINPQTGIISGIAPEAGKYVVSVCIAVYRNGQLITNHRKDFIITVAPCDFAGAQLAPSYLSCDGFTFTFDNLNTSPLNISYYWDFGDGNTSNAQSPTHTYAVAGIYTLKLVVNRGAACSDSTTSQLSVFPGYFPGFTNNAPMCKGRPVSFSDSTIANYGAPNRWRWDFGDPEVTNDTSLLENPTYTYNTAGTYTVQLLVQSDKGCSGTYTDTVVITDKPAFSVTNDTLICSIDTLQLNAVAGTPGNVTWSPNYNISNVNSFNPLVSPDVTTVYTVSYSNSFGCSAIEQVRVNVVDFVTLNTMADTTICTTDPVILQVNSNALQYTWTPAATLNDPTLQDPVAIPTGNTQYTVVGTIGKCTTTDMVNINTVPYPPATVTPDFSICFGEDAPLMAGGGSIYTWSPPSFLNATNIPNPIAIQPSTSVTYNVSVRDVLGCPKPVIRTVRVTVVKILADAGPADTSIVLGQPLQLNATGSLFYSWDPPIWLNSTSISNPIAYPQDNIQYHVRVSDAAGCFGNDSINVKLYKIEPDLLVPSAFSPNGDGNNDVFRPIPIGMKSLDAFRVYNRWGQLLFSTTQQNLGWDGKLSGANQDSGTYVWYAEGVDYKGKKIQRKGYVVLIR